MWEMWKSEDARHLTERAEELREKVEHFSPANRKMLLQLAEQFERIASEAESWANEGELSTRL